MSVSEFRASNEGEDHFAGGDVERGAGEAATPKPVLQQDIRGLAG